MEMTPFSIPILALYNESETETLDILIEPHLELYELPPKKCCKVYYFQTPDNNVPEKTLTVAHRDDCIVIFPPGDLSPELRIDGVSMENMWG